MKKFALLTVFSLLCAHVVAQPLMLLTDEDVAREAAAPLSIRPAKTRAFGKSSDAPKIQVLSPNIAKAAFTSPLPIDLRFASNPDAEIDPASFKASYGFLNIDITNRIIQSVKVTKNGFTVPEASLPKGSHRLTLQVADTKGRQGEMELKFTVE